MSSDLVRDIVYEDDKIIAYADYDLVGRINYEEDVDLWIVNKDGAQSGYNDKYRK